MRKKGNLFLVLITIVFLVILFIPTLRRNTREAFYGVLSKPSAILSEKGRAAKRFFSFYIHIGQLKKQNSDLTSTIQNLEVDRSRIIELEKENAILKKELGYLEVNPEAKLLSSRIIGREPTSFLDYIIIDKGAKNGVTSNMAVLSGGVLIGQVRDVFENQSKVVLITSKDSLVLAMLQNSRSKGLLKGGISGLVLENITQDVSYEPGEYIVTSGLDGQLKPGILIGKTGSIQTSSSDLYKNISVEPIADLSRLELVFVVIE